MVSLVYLTVSDGSALLPGHWTFDFEPATSDQSRVFLSSAAVRQTFATLAPSVAAPHCACVDSLTRNSQVVDAVR